MPGAVVPEASGGGGRRCPLPLRAGPGQQGAEGGGPCPPPAGQPTDDRSTAGVIQAPGSEPEHPGVAPAWPRCAPGPPMCRAPSCP